VPIRTLHVSLVKQEKPQLVEAKVRVRFRTVYTVQREGMLLTTFVPIVQKENMVLEHQTVLSVLLGKLPRNWVEVHRIL